MNAQNKTMKHEVMLVCIISSLLTIPPTTFATSDGGVSECVTVQYGSSGTDIDTVDLHQLSGVSPWAVVDGLASTV